MQETPQHYTQRMLSYSDGKDALQLQQAAAKKLAALVKGKNNNARTAARTKPSLWRFLLFKSWVLRCQPEVFINLKRMTIRIPNDGEIGFCNRVGNERSSMRSDRGSNCCDVINDEMSVPEKKIAGARIGRQSPSSWRRDIFEELDPGTAGGAKSGDSEASSKDLIQAFLLNAIILAFARYAQAEEVAVKG